MPQLFGKLVECQQNPKYVSYNEFMMAKFSQLPKEAIKKYRDLYKMISSSITKMNK